jgi:RNA polymerase sigma factor (TIGR02999 family)
LSPNLACATLAAGGTGAGGMSDVTEWIERARAGDAQASERLYAAVYDDLRQLARRLLRSQAPGRASATSLVHETFMRLAKPGALKAVDRRHFFAIAGRAMRQLVRDRARARGTAKRGGAVEPLPLDADDADLGADLRLPDAMAMDQALQRLGELDAELVELVEMRFFAGLGVEEIAELTDRSPRTVKRQWRRARAFLHLQLSGLELPDEPDA